MTALRYGRRSLRLTLALIWLYFILLQSDTFAFILPNAPSYRLDSRIRSTEAEENQNVQRYRNRAALTESILKEKMQEMKLIRSKVEVLQDVVKKLQSSKEKVAEHASVREMELTSRWKDEETKRIQADLQIKQLKLELNRTRTELMTQATRHTELMDNLTKEHGKARRAWKDEERQFRERDQVVQNKIRALQKEVLDIDQSLETTQGELMRMQQILASREDELRTLAINEGRKYKALEEKLEAALVENKSLQSKLDDYLASEEARRESIDIACAAVRAAEKREATLREELDTLRERFDDWLDAQSGMSDIVSGTSGRYDQKQKEAISQELEMEGRETEEGRHRYRKQYEVKQSAERWKSEAPLRSVPKRDEAELSKPQQSETLGSTTDCSGPLDDSGVTRESSKGQRGIWRWLRSPRLWFSTRHDV
jgi:hypothetical protein